MSTRAFHGLPRSLPIVALTLAVATFGSAGRAASAVGFTGTDPRLPYDQEVWPTVHNAYAEQTPLRQQLEEAGVRSLELDLHAGKRRRARLDGDWYVYHVNLPLLNRTRCDKLSGCLATLAEFHRRHPDHYPITVFLDMKDGFASGHTAEQLDAAILTALPLDAVFTPGDLERSCPSARSAAEAVQAPCGWPTLGRLRGKLVFALTGGPACRSTDWLRGYARDEAVARTRLGFLAPSLEDRCTVERYATDAPFIVYFNLEWSERGAAAALRASGRVTRLWGSSTHSALRDDQMAKAFRAGLANFLVTDHLGLARVGPEPSSGSIAPGERSLAGNARAAVR